MGSAVGALGATVGGKNPAVVTVAFVNHTVANTAPGALGLELWTGLMVALALGDGLV